MGWLQRGSLVIDLVAIAILTLLVLLAAASDIRQRRISNRLTDLMAITWVIVSLVAVVFGEEAWQIPLAAIGWSFILLVTGLLLFNLKVFGGGDVKMLAAAGLWLPSSSISILMPDQVVLYLLATTIAGGFISLIVLVRSRIVEGADRRVPYGVAIAVGILWVCMQPLVTAAM